ncbi:MAG: flavin reductase family protein [Bacteroidetes bacterium]|nr:flavin reductase family protein [Bacteroidota bacterium]
METTQYLLIDPADTEPRQLYAFLTGVIGPRPIAFASTIDAEGNPNLAPFSYFNMFSARPPVLIFSPNLSGRTGARKDTLLNAEQTGEVVINLVNHALVEQQNIASCEYPRGVNEFAKAGLTPSPSVRVRPARVAESPVQIECRVRQVVSLGDQGGAGNLIICDVLLMHVRAEVLDARGFPDPHKLDLVARMGADWYCRAHGDALFAVEKAADKTDIVGIDNLPEAIRYSQLTGNELGQLANRRALPAAEELAAFRRQEADGLLAGVTSLEAALPRAKDLLAQGHCQQALLLLLATV